MNPLHWLYYRYFFLRSNPIGRFATAKIGNPYVPTRETWNAEFTRGDWDRLRSLPEQAHNAILALYISKLKPAGSVLDIGCGDGVLSQLLSLFGRFEYLGVDISDEAIALAHSLEDGHTHFLVADAETFCPDHRFDAVILDESIYYFRHPINTVVRYAHDCLNPTGIVAMSMFDHSKTRPILRALIQRFTVLADTTVTNNIGMWHCDVFIPTVEAGQRKTTRIA